MIKWLTSKTEIPMWVYLIMVFIAFTEACRWLFGVPS